MINSKILLAALAVMLVFAVVPMASAGGDGTVNNPYTALYIGWSWEYEGWGSGISMGFDSNSTPITSMTVNGTTYNGLTDVFVSDLNVSGVYIRHVYMDLDTMNYTLDPPNGTGNGVPVYVTESVMCPPTFVNSSGWDMITVDMFFNDTLPYGSSVYNQANKDFVAAFDVYFNGNTTTYPHLISVFAQDINDTESYAPCFFEVRDLLHSWNTDFAEAFFEGLEESGATPENADWEMYLDILWYIRNAIGSIG